MPFNEFKIVTDWGKGQLGRHESFGEGSQIKLAATL